MISSNSTIQSQSIELFRYARFFKDPMPILAESTSTFSSDQAGKLGGLYLQKIVVPLDISLQNLVAYFPDLSLSECVRRCAHLLAGEGKEEWLLVQEALESGAGEAWIKKIDEQSGKTSPKAQAARSIVAILKNPAISQLLLQNVALSGQTPSETEIFSIRMQLLLQNSHEIHSRVAAEIFEGVAIKLGFEPALLAERLPQMTLGELCRWGIVQEGISKNASDPVQLWEELQVELRELSASRGFDTVLYSPWLRELPLESFCKLGTDSIEAQIEIDARLEEYRAQTGQFYSSLKEALTDRVQKVVSQKKQKNGFFAAYAQEMIAALEGQYTLPKLVSLKLQMDSLYRQSLELLWGHKKKLKNSAVVPTGKFLDKMGLDIFKQIDAIQKQERELFDSIAKRQAAEKGKSPSDLELMAQSESLQGSYLNASFNSNEFKKVERAFSELGLSKDLLKGDPFSVLGKVMEQLTQVSIGEQLDRQFPSHLGGSQENSATLLYKEMVELALLFKGVVDHLECSCSMTPLADGEMPETIDDANWFEQSAPRPKQKKVAVVQSTVVPKRTLISVVERVEETLPLQHLNPIDQLMQQLGNGNAWVHGLALVHCLELMQKGGSSALFALSHLHLFLEQLLKPSPDSQEHHLVKLTGMEDPLLQEHALDSLYLRYPTQIRQRLHRVYARNPLAIEGAIALLNRKKVPDGFVAMVEQDSLKALVFAADYLGIEPPAQLPGAIQNSTLSLEEREGLMLQVGALQETLTSLTDRVQQHPQPAMQDATYHLIALQQSLALFVDYPDQRYLGLFAHHMVESLSLFFELTAYAKSNQFTHHNLEQDLLLFPDLSQATQSTVKMFNVQKKLHYPDLITHNRGLAAWVQDLRLLSAAAPISGEEGFIPINWKGGTPAEERQKLLLLVGRGITAAQEWISKI